MGNIKFTSLFKQSNEATIAMNSRPIAEDRRRRVYCIVCDCKGSRVNHLAMTG